MEKEQVLHNIPSLQINVKRMIIEKNSLIRGKHFHKEVEIIHVEKGKVLCTVGEEEVELDEGKVILINCRAFHQLSYRNEECEITYLQIDMREYFYQLFPSFSEYMYLVDINNTVKRYIVSDVNTELHEIFQKVSKECLHITSHYDVAVKGYVYLLIAYMLRSNVIVHPESFRSNKSVNMFLPAIEYIERNYMNKITLENVSRITNMNKYSFCKMFKKVFGVTFVEYLNMRRLVHAETLLRYSDKSITEIAYESGFMSIQYFLKVFKKNLNCLPSVYRKNNNEQL